MVGPIDRLHILRCCGKFQLAGQASLASWKLAATIGQRQFNTTLGHHPAAA
jgi:hypothetical protein